jgi:FKBP-type peptidyl-prolyl cis-trans isomerase (trigger factor)
VELPDYRKIALDVMKDKTPVVVSEEEVTEALVHLKRERIRVEGLELGIDPEEAVKKSQEAAVEELPPLDEEFVKAIGFESAAAFEARIRENLQANKEDHVRSEYRAKLLKRLSESVTTDIPEALIEYELAKMEAGLAHYIAQNGQSIDAYYKQINKTREDIFKEWRADALNRAQQQLVLIEIARKESITEDTKELEALVADVLTKDPKADETAVRSHYQVILRNDKVLQWLEALPNTKS